MDDELKALDDLEEWMRQQRRRIIQSFKPKPLPKKERKELNELDLTETIIKRGNTNHQVGFSCDDDPDL